MVPEDAFEDRSSITHLAVGSNPFYCNCDLKWLSEWVKTDFIEPGIAKCAAPHNQKDKLLLTSPSEHFQCLGKWKNHKSKYPQLTFSVYSLSLFSIDDRYTEISSLLN